MRLSAATVTAIFCLIVLGSLKNVSADSIGYDHAVDYFKTQSIHFSSSALQLQSSIQAIDLTDGKSIAAAKKALTDCRSQYKKIEFFLAYFFKGSAVFFNGPPKYEIEEPFMEWQTPIGLQVVESLLFESDSRFNKAELLQQAEAISSSARDLNSLLYDFKASDKEILESVRIELIRIYTLGITGFDAPLLKSGIAESMAALSGVQSVLDPYLQLLPARADSVRLYMKKSFLFLSGSTGFDSFDRLHFYTDCGLPLQYQLGILIKELGLTQNSSLGILNYDAGNIFSPDALDINAFPGASAVDSRSLRDLGKKLFLETALSGNNKISCATCHDPNKHFSDGLPKSPAFGGHSTVKRNAISLLYAGFQFSQFWDGRAATLEEQIATVISSPDEMNGSHLDAIKAIKSSDQYRRLFTEAFHISSDSIITLATISRSLACFVRSLNPRNAAFDRYMMGDNRAMTPAQQRGFNLFMGKAQCGTCHFAPLFNGLLPPYYNLTEFEVPGTPATDNLESPLPDLDSGRYNFFPIGFYQRAFKTPTVRNVSATGPYMHNGSFGTLEKVMEFYNKGGGNGLGLKLPNQTLSALPLHLSLQETDDVVSFMKALTDVIAK